MSLPKVASACVECAARAGSSTGERWHAGCRQVFYRQGCPCMFSVYWTAAQCLRVLRVYVQ